MASYEMGGSPAPGGKDEKTKVSFRFCRECSNMLYPKEDRTTNTLMFACRTCQFAEEANATCIWRNSLKEDVQATAGNVDDVAQDPTVGDFDQDTAMADTTTGDYAAEGEDIIPEMCTLCGQEILCPICEKPTDAGLALEVDDPDLEAQQQRQEELVEAERRERALSGARFRPS